MKFLVNWKHLINSYIINFIINIYINIYYNIMKFICEYILIIYIPYYIPYYIKMSFIQHKNKLNITLNELIKDVLNYEDKELDTNTILLSIRFSESVSDFDEIAFKSDIKYAYKCIKKFKSKNKKINITKYIEDIEKYVLSNLNEWVAGTCSAKSLVAYKYASEPATIND